jgi:hypothetical protein
MGAGNASGPFDYAILYLFFVPNLLVAEFFIRNQHKHIAAHRVLRWLALCGLAVVGLIFAYAAFMVSATPSGKYGSHLLQLFSN